MFKDDELHETRYCENCLKLQQELQEVMDNYVNLDLSRVKEYNELVDKYKAKEQECDKLKFNLKGADILGLMKRNVQLKKALDDIELQIKALSNRTPLFEIEQIAKDIIKIQDIINKANEK